MRSVYLKRVTYIVTSLNLLVDLYYYSLLGMSLRGRLVQEHNI